MTTRPLYKTDEWMQVETRFRSLDNGGKIDDSILDLVVVLNLIGIHTTGSCAGHLNEQGAPPGIVKTAWMRDRPIPGQGRTDYPFVSILMQDVEKLLALLEEFYAPHIFFNYYELGIVLYPSGCADLRNSNASRVFHGQDSELEQYQKEFSAFTSWLKRGWRTLRKEIQAR
jgi:hypothetical protein